MNTLLVFIGAGFGGVSRFLTSKGLASLLGQNFPYGTLAVNILGSFIMGFLYVLILDRLHGVEDYLRPLMLTGFLGGFTTFSSFSIETLILAENGSYLVALSNILLNITLCLVFVWLGVLGGRQL
jgi:fluoride exporter